MRVIIALLALLLSAPPASSQFTCIDIPGVEQIISHLPQYTNLRLAEKDAIATLLDLYRYTTGEPDPDWDTAMLVDLKDGGGSVMYGTKDVMCNAVAVPADYWDELIPLIEPRKA